MVSLRRLWLVILLSFGLISALQGPVLAQSGERVFVDVPIAGQFVVTAPQEWAIWSGDVYVTAQQEQLANSTADILVESVYPSFTIETTFANQYRQFIGLPPTPPEEGVVYMLVEIVPVADVMRVAAANEQAVTTPGLIRAINAQLLTTIDVNGRTASFGINRSAELASVVAAYRFPVQAQLALVKVIAPNDWLTANVAAVRLLVTSLRLQGELIDEAAYLAFAGEPMPENFQLPSDEPLIAPTFDLPITQTAGPRVDDIGILPTAEGSVSTPVALAPTAAAPPQQAQPQSGNTASGPGNRDAQGRCIIPDGWSPYVIVPGDTLNLVAARFGSSLNELRNGNCIRNVDLLPWGTTMYVPNGGRAVAPVASPVVSTSTGPLYAQGCTDPSTVITSPYAGQTLSGTFQVAGTASLDNLAYYKIEIRPNFSEVFNYVGSSDVGVVNGQLARLRTGAFGTGVYYLRLTVVDTTGNFPEPCTIPVVFQ